MKIIQINDNIKINIEMIYSLEYHNNQLEINEWENNYKKYFKMFSEDPPLLPIDDNEVFQPIRGENNDDKKMQLYLQALEDHIYAIIGDQPTFNENYFVILSTGLKININKIIYDKINEYLNKFVEDI